MNTSDTVENIEYYIHKGELYQMSPDNVVSIAQKVKVPKTDKLFKWHGSKIPMSLHRKIISFFIDGYKKTSSENLVFLYYDMDAKEWMAWAPPQYYAGMTVGFESDESDKEYREQRSEIPERFVQMGTYHHHCSGGAFASGTDKSDESQRDGLHVTIGGLGQKKEKLSAHARATFKNKTYDTCLSEWLEPPEWIESFPKQYQNLFQKALIEIALFPEKDEEYPDIWISNLKKKESLAFPTSIRTGFSSMIQQAQLPLIEKKNPKARNTGDLLEARSSIENAVRDYNTGFEPEDRMTSHEIKTISIFFLVQMQMSIPIEDLNEIYSNLDRLTPEEKHIAKSVNKALGFFKVTPNDIGPIVENFDVVFMFYQITRDV